MRRLVSGRAICRGPCPDVVVIGGGIAGWCAAIEARRAGARVLLLEQAPPSRRGGNARHARNLRIAHDQPSAFIAGRYPQTELLQDLDAVNGGNGNPALARLTARASLDVPDWLRAAGVALQPRASGVLPLSRKTVFLLGGGTAALQALAATARRLGVLVREASPVAAIRLTATGARLDTPLGQMEPHATVAACGGPQANRAWLEAHWGSVADAFVNRGIPDASGRLLLELLAQGAGAVGDPGAAHLVAVDARSPADDGGIVTRVRGMPAGIVVDQDACRLADEGAVTGSDRYSFWGQQLARCRTGRGYLLLDAAGLRQVPPSLYPPVIAPTLAALAERLGLDPAALLSTVAAYNAATRAPADGQDSAGWHTLGSLPPKSRHARPLSEPPFAAYPLCPGITFVYYGLAVDAQARVLHESGTPLPGLFAAGTLMAPNVLRGGYLSGLALTIAIVFGRIAGAEAARHAGI